MKPKLPFRGFASRYEAPGERILEFSGGLISIRNRDGGTVFELYRLDPGVRVICPPENLDKATRRAIEEDRP